MRMPAVHAILVATTVSCFSDAPTIPDGANTATSSSTSSDGSGSADASVEGGSASSTTNDTTVETSTSPATTDSDTGTDSSQTASSDDTTAGPSACEAPHLRVFVSSVVVDGAIEGECGGVVVEDPLLRADCFCQLMADSIFSERGTFLAWLGTQPDPVSTRLAPKASGTRDLPFCLVDGTLVAHSWMELIDPETPLINPINLDESGQLVGGFVWTGTDAAGEATEVDCDGWTSGPPSVGERGSPDETDSAWTHGASSGCGNSLRLYCFER
jgi:hypothetical protein